MPDSVLIEFHEQYVPETGARRAYLDACARYCRRLAAQSDRPASIRSLTALAAEFEQQAEAVAIAFCSPG
jgi:hypothetical protein